MGYAGGTTANPSYHNIGDYSETVEVLYDPDIVTYEQLLAAFWTGHDATYPPYSRQYRSAVFYNSEQQQSLAQAAKQSEEARIGQTTYTSIEPFTGFFIAEDYHQKYYLRQRPDIVNDLYAVYPSAADFRDSTAVARLNGYLGGYGEAAKLMDNLDKLGLSDSGKEVLLQTVKSGLTNVCPVAPP